MKGDVNYGSDVYVWVIFVGVYGGIFSLWFLFEVY
jgi:hypothetical protein